MEVCSCPSVDLAVDLKGAPAPSRNSVNNCTVQPERLKTKQVQEPSSPPENLDFERITDKERRLLLRRIRSTPSESVKNPFTAIAEGFPLPDEGLDLPPIRSVLPDTASIKRWREQVRHEQEQRALAYFSLDDGQGAENHRPSTARVGINTIKRPLSKLERQIGSFAESIGFSLDNCILKSVARGATVTIDGQRYRAQADGCLYQQSTPTTTTALTRLTALWHRQIPEQTRLVGEHLRKEAIKQKSEE